LEEDVKIRKFLNNKLKTAYVSEIIIERLENNINILLKPLDRV
jgi:ribosomal protein S3